MVRQTPRVQALFAERDALHAQRAKLVKELKAVEQRIAWVKKALADERQKNQAVDAAVKNPDDANELLDKLYVLVHRLASEGVELDPNEQALKDVVRSWRDRRLEGKS